MCAPATYSLGSCDGRAVDSRSGFPATTCSRYCCDWLNGPAPGTVVAGWEMSCETDVLVWSMWVALMGSSLPRGSCSNFTPGIYQIPNTVEIETGETKNDAARACSTLILVEQGAFWEVYATSYMCEGGAPELPASVHQQTPRPCPCATSFYAGSTTATEGPHHR